MNTGWLLICKTKDSVLAQYAVNMINAPVGISEYELSTLIPKEYKKSMPTIEEIENELKDEYKLDESNAINAAKINIMFESSYGDVTHDFFAEGRVQDYQVERDSL